MILNLLLDDCVNLLVVGSISVNPDRTRDQLVETSIKFTQVLNSAFLINRPSINPDKY